MKRAEENRFLSRLNECGKVWQKGKQSRSTAERGIEREGLVRRGWGLPSAQPIGSRLGQAMTTGVGASERSKEREREHEKERGRRRCIFSVPQPEAESLVGLE